MANNLQIVVKMARVLANAHIVVGALLICLGIADYATSTRHDSIAGHIAWIGFWMCVTGGLGISGSRRGRTRSRNCFFKQVKWHKKLKIFGKKRQTEFFSSSKFQGPQVVYTATTPMYVMTHGPDGIPVVVPIQAVDGMVAVQASGSQGRQPSVMLMPSAGAVGGEPSIVQTAPSHAVEDSGYPPQRSEMPFSYGHGQNTPLNEEVSVKI